MATCPTCRTRYENDVAHCTKDGDTLLPDEAFQGVDAELAPGDMVGEYRVEGKLGEGGFGTVYAVVHPLIGKKAALKTLHRQYSSNPQMVSRFIAEARAVNQIRHRNIIDIFSFGGLPDGRQYYLMELLDGQSFDEYLKQKGRLSPEQALPILRSIARALDAAHAAGIAHRDLKPENIFLVFDEDGGIMPKLLDFGIAKLLTTTSGGHKTRTGAPMGTPNYMSPEQCRGTQVDHRTDIYAFGVLCHQVLTGHLPFDGEALMDILVKHMTKEPPRASEQNPELKPELDAPIQHMLAKEPGDRPPSVGAAFEELADAARRAGYSFVGAGGGGTSGSPGVITGPRPQATLALGEAKTISAASASQTLTPVGEHVGGAKPRGALFAAITVAIVLVGTGGAYVVTRRRAAPAPAGGVAVSASAVTTVTAVAPPPASSSPPEPPTEVELTIQATPPDAMVFLGKTKLGPASTTLHLPFGTTKVAVTLKAPGYKPSTVEVVPKENTVVDVTLAKAPKSAISKDLEPFN